MGKTFRYDNGVSKNRDDDPDYYEEFVPDSVDTRKLKKEASILKRRNSERNKDE